MVPAPAYITDLVAHYLDALEAEAWSTGDHALVEVQERCLERSTGPTISGTRRSKSSRELCADLDAEAALADRMLRTLSAIDPDMRQALELAAVGATVEQIGRRLRRSQAAVHALLDRAAVAGQTFLLVWR